MWKYILIILECFDNCLICDTQNLCKVCENRYYLSSDGDKCDVICSIGEQQLNGKCFKCEVYNCSNCNQSVKVCQSCIKPLYLYENQCMIFCPPSTFSYKEICISK